MTQRNEDLNYRLLDDKLDDIPFCLRTSLSMVRIFENLREILGLFVFEGRIIIDFLWPNRTLILK